MTRSTTRRRYASAAAAIGFAALAGCPEAGPEDNGNGVDEAEVDDEEGIAEEETVDHENPDGEVQFIEPEDGDTVTSPVDVEMAVEDFELEPAAEPQNGDADDEEQDPAIRDGHGHLHVIVDEGCLEPEQHIPFEDGYHHLGEGGTEITLELDSGEYELCAQASDGAHLAYDMTDVITIEVEEDGNDGNGDE